MSSVDWPESFDRTPPDERQSTRKYATGIGQTCRELESEMNRIGADDWRLSTDAPTRKGEPYRLYQDADRYVEDPAAVVRWVNDGEDYAIACDYYTELRDNLRTIFLYIREKRKMQDRPVKTGFDEFATARLPAGNGHSNGLDTPPHEILGIPEDAPKPVVKAAWRYKSKETHPDAGGGSDQQKRLNQAKEAMLHG